MAGKRTSKLQFISAIQKHKGMVVDVCKELQITPQAFYKRIRTNPELKEEFEQSRDTMIDFCESKLKQLIEEGHFPSIQFYLQCIGKNRGWVTKQEHHTTTETKNYVVAIPQETMIEDDDVEEIETAFN